MKPLWENKYDTRLNPVKKITRDNALIVIPMSLLEKIDRNRDKYGRAEFIELCIDTLLEHADILLEQSILESESTQLSSAPRATKSDGAKNAVSRAEFEEFTGGVKDLLYAYIDLLSDSNSDKVASEVQERLNELKGFLRRSR